MTVVALEQRRRAHAHQCRSCRRSWAMDVVHHPSGTVTVCRYCGVLGSRISRVVPDPDVHAPLVALLRGLDGPGAARR